MLDSSWTLSYFFLRIDWGFLLSLIDDFLDITFWDVRELLLLTFEYFINWAYSGITSFVCKILVLLPERFLAWFLILHFHDKCFADLLFDSFWVKELSESGELAVLRWVRGALQCTSWMFFWVPNIRDCSHPLWYHLSRSWSPRKLWSFRHLQFFCVSQHLHNKIGQPSDWSRDSSSGCMNL